ncbi:hypothetical protein RUND412_004630 [Rhizina undulata]
MAASDPNTTFLLLTLLFLASNALFLPQNFETVVDCIIFAVGSSAIAFVSYLAWIFTLLMTKNGTLSIFTAILVFFGWDYVPWIIFIALLCFPFVVGIILAWKTAKKVGKETAFIENFRRLIVTAEAAILNILDSIISFLRSVVDLFQRDVLPDTHCPPVQLISPSLNSYPTTTCATSSPPTLHRDINRVYVDYRLNERYVGQNKLGNMLVDVPTWREILKYDLADLSEEDRRQRIRIRKEIAEDNRKLMAQIWKAAQVDELLYREREARLNREEKRIRDRTADYKAQASKSPWVQQPAPIITEMNPVRAPQIIMETPKFPVYFNPAVQKETLRAQKMAARAALKEERRVWYNAEKAKRDAEEREYNSRLEDLSYWVKEKRRMAEALMWERKNEEMKRIQEVQNVWDLRVIELHNDEEDKMLYEQWRGREDRFQELDEERLWWEERPPSERELQRAEEAQMEL